MADLEGLKVEHDYHVDTPFATSGKFHVKGAGNLDWGMKKHLSNIFNPRSGNSVMFAFDHGYFMGSVSGLERLDLLIPKLAKHVDVLMGTRGALRTCVSPSFKNAILVAFSMPEVLSPEYSTLDVPSKYNSLSDLTLKKTSKAIKAPSLSSPKLSCSIFLLVTKIKSLL